MVVVDVTTLKMVRKPVKLQNENSARCAREGKQRRKKDGSKLIDNGRVCEANLGHREGSSYEKGGGNEKLRSSNFSNHRTSRDHLLLEFWYNFHILRLQRSVTRIPNWIISLIIVAYGCWAKNSIDAKTIFSFLALQFYCCAWDLKKFFWYFDIGIRIKSPRKNPFECRWVRTCSD